MTKPTTRQGYGPAITEACERALVTLIHDFAPWRDSFYLIGGLVPRYLIKDLPVGVPAYAGTRDADVVVDTTRFGGANASPTLKQYITGSGFEHGENEAGKKQTWRWQMRTVNTVSFLELLVDSREASGGTLQDLTPQGDVSAVRIPRAAMVFDHYCKTNEVDAELPDGRGTAKVTVRHANIVSFTCLKAFAFISPIRNKRRKDAYDLCYCLEHYNGGTDALHTAFEEALKGTHADKIKKAIDILEQCFRDSDDIEGCRENGPAAAVCFENVEDWTDSDRIRRRRDLSDIVQRAIAPFLSS